MFCDALGLFDDDTEVIFNRKDIRQVRLEPSPENNARLNQELALRLA